MDGRNILRSKIGIAQKIIKRLQNIICKEDPFNFKVCLSTDYFLHRLVMVVAMPRRVSHSIDSFFFSNSLFRNSQYRTWSFYDFQGIYQLLDINSLIVIYKTCKESYFSVPFLIRHLQSPLHTGLFISPSGTSELDCATTKKDRAERSISIGTESLKVFFFVLGALAYLQVPPLGGSRDEKWRAQ